MSLLPALTTVELRSDGPVGILCLNRPQARNAIDDPLRADLRVAIDYVATHPEIRGLVVTGNGPAFCAGGDIRGMQERLEQGGRAGELGWRRLREIHETLSKLFNLDRPTVAAVNGAAFGLGLDLALNCDLVYLADSATVAANFVHRGVVPDGGGMFHLPRRVGLAKAKELVFSGRNVKSTEALAMGLVDRVLPATELVPAAVAWLKSCAELPAMAQALAKNILNRSYEMSLEQVNMVGSQAQAYCYLSPEHQNSVRAFLAERDQAKKDRKP